MADLILERPQAGQRLEYSDLNDARIVLGFPSEDAVLERQGDSLVFTFDDGSSVILNDFYNAFTRDTLPEFSIDGQAVSGGDFFAALGDESLMPAAGPAQQVADGGRYHDLSDMAFYGGINRLDGLDLGWNGGVEPERDLWGAGENTDIPTLDALSFTVDNLFEDAMPFANQGDDQTLYGRLNLSFSGGPNTVLDAVTLNGLHEGSTIFIGQPGAAGTQEIVIGADGSIRLTADQLNAGVYLKPPVNSDADMQVGINAEYHSSVSGLADSASFGPYTVVVDAVADLATEQVVRNEGIDYQDHTESASHGEAANIKIAAGATFGDVLDGSETHLIRVSGIPTDWDLNLKSLPEGWVLCDANGKPIDPADMAADFDAHDTRDFYFNVTQAARDNAEDPNDPGTTGRVEAELEFNPHDWTSNGSTANPDAGRWTDGTLNEHPATVGVSGVSIENPSDGELPGYNNNRAETDQVFTEIDLTEDTPDVVEAPGKAEMNEAFGTDGDVNLAGLSPSVQDALNGIAQDHGLGTPLAASQSSVSFDLHSDGIADPNPVLNGSGPSVSFNPDNLPDMQAKLTSGTEEDWKDIVWKVDGDKLIGTIGPNGPVAVVGVISTDYDANGTGSSSITFVQYQPVQHTGQGTNPLDVNFGLKVVDEDGDVATTTVNVSIKDSTPEALDDATVTFDEADPPAGGVISGNVLDNDTAGSDGWYGGGGDGSTGGGGEGVLSYQISGLPDGYILRDAQGNEADPANLDPGTEYTVCRPNQFDDGETPQGSFTLNKDGSWTFTQGDGDIVKDYDFTVRYTVKDADGDEAHADMKVDVNAGPLTAGITTTTPELHESNQTVENPTLSQDDKAPTAVYVIQAYDHEGNKAGGEALFEEMRVTLTIEPSSILDDLVSQQAILDANPGQDIAFNNDGTITVTIPAGSDGSFELKLPLYDDAKGGYGTTSDGPKEQFTVSISKVEGSEGDYLKPGDSHCPIGADGGKASTTIVDDGAYKEDGEWVYAPNRLDGDKPYDHAQDDHPYDGPMFKLTAPTELAEGDAFLFHLGGTIDPNTGTAYTGGHPEETITVEFKLTLNDATENNDLSVTVGKQAGATYYYEDANGNWQKVPASGTIPQSAYKDGELNVRVELGTNFDLNKLDKVGLNVKAVDDTVTEAKGSEGFTVAITGATGNESTYYGDPTKEVTITETHDGRIAITNAEQVLEGGNMVFTIVVTDTKIQAGNDLYNDTVRVELQLGGAAGANSNAAGLEDLELTLKAFQDANPDIKVVEVNADGSVIIEIPASAWDGDSSHPTYDFNVPTKVDANVAEARETVTVEITGASGAEIDYKASAESTESGHITGKGDIVDEAGLSISGTPKIYEDPRMGSNVAEYTISVDDKKIPVDDAQGPSGKVTGQGFSFDVTLKDGSAWFDNNLTDNDMHGHKDGGQVSGMGDYAWALPVPDGKGGYLESEYMQYDLSTPEGRTAFENAYNDYLESKGYGVGDQFVTVSVSENGRTITFNIPQGMSVDKLEDMPIRVYALDDAVDDDGERYTVSIGNIKEAGTADDYDSIGTTKDHSSTANTTVDTTIVDDGDPRGNGYSIGLGDGFGMESDKYIRVPVLAFAREEGDPLFNEGNPPVDGITITIVITGGSAEENRDFYTDNGWTMVGTDKNGNSLWQTTLPGGEANWHWVGETADGIEPHVDAHWEYVGDATKIPVNDDRLTEGTEDIKVSLDSVSGHESEVREGENTATLEIKDDRGTGTTSDFDVKDGQLVDAYGDPVLDRDGNPISTDGYTRDKHGDLVNADGDKLLELDDNGNWTYNGQIVIGMREGPQLVSFAPERPLYEGDGMVPPELIGYA